jgi:hypothetical protein
MCWTRTRLNSIKSMEWSFDWCRWAKIRHSWSWNRTRLNSIKSMEWNFDWCRWANIRHSWIHKCIGSNECQHFVIGKIEQITPDTKLIRLKVNGTMGACSHIDIKDDTCEIARSYTPISGLGTTICSIDGCRIRVMTWTSVLRLLDSCSISRTSPSGLASGLNRAACFLSNTKTAHGCEFALLVACCTRHTTFIPPASGSESIRWT